MEIVGILKYDFESVRATLACDLEENKILNMIKPS